MNHLNTNSSIVQYDEQLIAEYLRKRNLDKVNAESKPVYIKDTIYTRYIKRILDLIIAIPFFSITLPFNFLFAICTFFDVGRPILFKQIRIGLNGKRFCMIKFRNMKNTTDKDGNLLPARERVTKFGFFMRSHSLDELLNLWSVIRGDMSIIGPRPLPDFFHERMSERHKMRSAVRPGLECPRMINVEGELYQKQFENDVWYVENVSFLLDLRMVFLLVKMTLNRKERKSAKGGSYFVGYDDNCRAIYKELAIKEYGELLSAKDE